ncbi:MAG: flagellar basal body rod protein FlgB [Dethiobacteria bacterium]
MSLFNDVVMDRLAQGLDMATMRQKVTAHNLANLNTPRFKRSYISFEENLQKAREKRYEIRATHPRHFTTPPAEPVTPEIKVDDTVTRRIDGNNVDLEVEVLNMVTNQLRYNTLIQQSSNRFKTWQYVIHQGRR